MHCSTVWETIRAESLESIPSNGRTPDLKERSGWEEGSDRREWLGYASKEEEEKAKSKYKEEKETGGAIKGVTIEEVADTYNEFPAFPADATVELVLNDEHAPAATEKEQTDPVAPVEEKKEVEQKDEEWKSFWSKSD